MTLEDRKNLNSNIIQNLILENRGKLSISGVLDVLSFDDQIVIVETELRFVNCKRRRFANKQIKHWYFRSSSRRGYIQYGI